MKELIQKYYNINEKTYNFLNKFILSTSAIILLILWAFFEASFWFIAPDLLITIYCFFPKSNHKKFINIAIISSIIGGIFYLILTFLYPIQITNILIQTPFVNEGKLSFVSNLFSNHGVISTLLQSFSFIPFKIWTNQAVLNNFNLFFYFSLVAISRIIRFYFGAFISKYLGKKFEKFNKKNIIPIFIVYIAIFLILLVIIE
jgi:membrane protein YqaA with SNARE-associated domain